MAYQLDSTAECDQFCQQEYTLHRQIEACEGQYVAQDNHRISLYFTLCLTHAPLRTCPLPSLTDSIS